MNCDNAPRWWVDADWQQSVTTAASSPGRENPAGFSHSASVPRCAVLSEEQQQQPTNQNWQTCYTRADKTTSQLELTKRLTTHMEIMPHCQLHTTQTQTSQRREQWQNCAATWVQHVTHHLCHCFSFATYIQNSVWNTHIRCCKIN